MNKNILNTGVQQYIRNFSKDDILAVAFQKQIFPKIENKELVQQLEGRRKCLNKLPLWYTSKGIFYPPKRALEQSSSQLTARYKSKLVSGKTLVDITGGFGVDSLFLSQKVDRLTYCEMSKELADIACYNFEVLGATNIDALNIDGLKYLERLKESVDWVYLDPSRRDPKSKRVFRLEDADPPLPAILSFLWQKTDNILIKTSPLLDLSSGFKTLESVKEVYVIAVKNEVKELLWVLKKNYQGDPLITAVNLVMGDEQAFSFAWQEEKSSPCKFGNLGDYLYEPHAAIMKSGAFKLVAKRFGLRKLHEHSHLYTSDTLKEFPGKRFRVEASFKYNRKNIEQSAVQKANITTRNFPYSVAALRKKHRISDGGDQTMFFTTDYKGDLVVVLCRRV